MSAVHDGHGPLRCHDGCPAYAEFMAEMHDQMRPAEPPVSTGAPESKAAPSRPCINCGQPLPHVGTGWKESGACRRNEGNATLADKAAPGMVDVLAKHLFTLYPGEIACDCEWTNRDDGTRQGECRMIAAHIAHVAAALSTAGFGDTAAARAEALTQAADEMDRFRREVYGEHIFRRPTPDEYREINALLKRERQHQTDDIGADCFDRAIRVQADLLRARAERQARDE